MPFLYHQFSGGILCPEGRNWIKQYIEATPDALLTYLDPFKELKDHSGLSHDTQCYQYGYLYYVPRLLFQHYNEALDKKNPEMLEL